MTCVQMFCTSFRVTGLTKYSSAPLLMQASIISCRSLADITAKGPQHDRLNKTQRGSAVLTESRVILYPIRSTSWCMPAECLGMSTGMPPGLLTNDRDALHCSLITDSLQKSKAINIGHHYVRKDKLKSARL